MEKEETARVEKYAQAHLDKTQTVATGATKVAVAWLIALALLWNEKLEPKLAEVQQAQATRHDLAVANANLINTTALSLRLKDQYDNTKNQEIDLPFSIKLTLAPQLVPTLWLTLALGLIWYLIFTRHRIFSLAIRGLRLFRLEAKSEPRYTTRVVGNAVWWLPPLPSGSNSEPSPEDLQQTLGFESSTIRIASLFCIFFSIALVLLELRVFYIGMVVTSFLVGIPPNNQPNISGWLLLSALDAALCCGFFLAVVKWFIPSRIQDATNDSTLRLLERRRAVRFALVGIGTICGSVVAMGSATYAFAGAWKGNGGRSNRESNGKRFRRKKNTNLSVKLPHGLYQNRGTGTIHTATPSCVACLSGINPANLYKISPADVPWITTKTERNPNPFALIQSLQPPVVASKVADPTPKVSTVHLHERHSVFIIEQHAMEMVQEGKTREACRMLWNVIDNEKKLSPTSDMRLYDLTAGLAIRSDQLEVLSSLVSKLRGVGTKTAGPDSILASLALAPQSPQPIPHGYLATYLLKLAGNRAGSVRKVKRLIPKNSPKVYDSHQQYLSAMVASRINTWQKVNGKWYRRWADKTKPVIWASFKIA